MIDVGALPPWPVDVVEDVEAVWSEQLELGPDGLLAVVTPLPHLGGAFVPLDALVQLPALLAQVLQVVALSFSLLAS
ncbi:MAG TPA: hypothetical protein VH857_07720 [Actinomycetes bacterium]|nr:hypothetical protein [Actinomycetes bacterium]